MHTSRLPGAILILVTLASAGLGADWRAQKPADRLRTGAALQRAERFADAEAVLGTLQEKDAEYGQAQTLLGYMYLRRSSLDPASKAFRKALAVDPGNTAARFGLGLELSRRALLKDAAEQFEQVFSDLSLGARARSQWIQISFWMGKDQEAYDEARKLSLEFPTVAEYQSLTGFLSHIRGDAEGARRAFERALELDPGRVSDYFSLVSLCRARKDWQGALSWIRKAIALDPDQPLMYNELAGICDKLGLAGEADAARLESRRLTEGEILYAKSAKARAEGRPGEAEDLLRRCLEANPRSSKAWTDLGEASRKKNRLDEARRSFERALQIEPSNQLALLGLAAVLAERPAGAQSGDGPTPGLKGASVDAAGRPGSEAVESLLLRAVRDYPDNADLLAYLGREQDARGNSAAAQQSFAEALRIDPLQVQATLGRAGHLLRTGETRRAIEEYRRAADLEPANMEAWRGLVLAQRESGEKKGAEASCRRCLDGNPQDPDCLELLAYLKMDVADYRAAAELFETLLRDGKATKELLDSQGFARMKLGETREAIGLYESSLKRYGPDAWVYFNLGYLYQAQGDIPSAIAKYRRARELSPRDPEINHNLAFALYLAKDYAAALEPFRTALRLKPGWGLAHFNLALTYWHLRQYAPALAHARIAEQKGLPGAERVVRALSSNLSLGMPRSVSVYRKK